MMRQLIARFAVWLCRLYNITLIDAARLNAPGDAVERSSRWEQFYREEGGIRDMLASLRQEAFEAAQEAGARDDQTRLAWMLQDRSYRKLQARIEGVIAAGKADIQRQQVIQAASRFNIPKS
jgi:hypothetical protein